jgi:CRISPR-associated endonuclease/helicase Cas3
MSEAPSIAHVRMSSDNNWDCQTVVCHSEGVARLAGGFASPFGSREWGELSGSWHDLGKFLPGWQAYLREKNGLSLEASLERDVPSDRGMHSNAGAVLAQSKVADPERDIRGRILAYCIAGHHAGLPNWEAESEGGFGYSLRKRLWDDHTGELRKNELDLLRKVPDALPFLERNLPSSPPLGVQSRQELNAAREHFHLWVRMLYSCLVDADSLDTEAFMEPEKGNLREGYENLGALKTRFDDFMERKQAEAPDTPINRLRREVLAACRAKASLPSGLFTLTVPTGGGKTLASMAFALEHALRHGKRRIVVAIPYTSIIEQTAKVLKYGTDDDAQIPHILEKGSWLFGEQNVLEHHSNLDPEQETPRNRLAAENWDAPIVVTTNVQLFESLLACSRSSCRKLHNLANSVIILDEAQMLPPEHLRPILSVLKGLVAHFGVTLLLCTATQPALTGMIGSQQTAFEGLPSGTEIVEAPRSLAEDLRRVQWKFPSDLSQPCTWEELAEELRGYDQVLCVVNTRRACRTLHALMPEGTVHLSAYMCGEERSEVIAGIKASLRRGEPVRVVSTQLVEAGVDIDFPVVYRALAGVDSLAQAAGRCNREGHLEGTLGHMVVFVPPEAAPVGLLRKGEDATRDVLAGATEIAFGPDLYERYFRSFYGKVNDFDAPHFRDRLVKEAGEWHFQFRTFASNFHLIDDNAQKSIIVWFKHASRDSLQLIEELRRLGPSRRISRQLQRFTVNVPERLFRYIRDAGYLEEIYGYAVQGVPGLYEPGLGLVFDEASWCQEVLCV